MGELREILRKNLMYYLQINHVSQKEFADKLGVSQSAVTNWIKGKNSPDIELLSEVCNIFDIEITDLMKNNEIQNVVDDSVTKLINNYKKLNKIGQQTLLEQSEMMVDSNTYKKTSKSDVLQKYA